MPVFDNHQTLIGASGAGAVYTIGQSVRFNDGDAPELSRTYSISAPWTFSAWVKRGELGSENLLLGASGGEIHFNSDDTLEAEGTTTSAAFRDVAAWYHIHVSNNGLYINGVSYGSVTTTNLTNTKLFDDFDGYVAEVHLQSGTSEYTNFGETNIDGQWVPKEAVSGDTYLKFDNSSDFGENSGSGGAWTASGLTATDQVLDTPTNNFAVLNILDVRALQNAGATFSEGNLKNRSGGTIFSFWFSVSSIPMTSGKWYCEIYVNEQNATTTSGLGISSNGISFLSTTFPAGTIVGVSIDIDSGTFEYFKNGVSHSTGSLTAADAYWFYLQPITSNYGSICSQIINFGQDSSFAGSVTAQNNTDDNGVGDFYYTPPSGHLALCTSNLPDPTIADPTEYFQTTLYTGTGSSQEVTQSGNSTFQPDWVWIKKRSGAAEHALTDVVRGVTKELSSNDSGAEETVAQGLTAFGSAGFTVGTDGSYNTSSATYVGWQWATDGTSGSSNSDGSITSTVSVNTTSGFSIVSYTGTGANATVGHGLGVAPQVLIVKNLIDTDSWVVYHEKLGATKGLTLDSSAVPTTDSTFFNNTAPTSSVFSVGSSGRTNGSSDGMIAYCFAEVEGFSKFGSYTGNGSTNGTFVYCGFRPAFVILKRTGGTESWVIFDTKRDPYNGPYTGQVLIPNLTLAEYSSGLSTGHIDFLSNGFKLRTSTAGGNASSGYIFMAFAEQPFKYANAR